MLNQLFNSIWGDYIQRLCPSAGKVHDLLEENETLINDHIALRTFDYPFMNMDKLAQHFIKLGYEAKGDYVFESKHLVAKHYEHPDSKQPKLFISELKVEKLSKKSQIIIEKMIQQVDQNIFNHSSCLYSGAPWAISYEDYQELAKESEYASWVAAHGYGANHFTVSVNQLNAYENVVDVNNVLRDAGFTINEFGGEVKGSPEVLLEQSSTMADKVYTRFVNEMHSVPGGFYEFAKRYPMKNGELYQGFVAASADKIFESTNQ